MDNKKTQKTLEQNQTINYNNCNQNQMTMENQTIINKTMEVINNTDWNNFHNFSWGRYQGSQGAFSPEYVIDWNRYTQDNWDFVQEHLEETYQDIYMEYMNDYVIPEYAKEIQEEEGCTEDEAYEMAIENADGISSIYFSIQHYFAETVNEVMLNAIDEVKDEIIKAISDATDRPAYHEHNGDGYYFEAYVSDDVKVAIRQEEDGTITAEADLYEEYQWKEELIEEMEITVNDIPMVIKNARKKAAQILEQK